MVSFSLIIFGTTAFTENFFLDSLNGQKADHTQNLLEWSAPVKSSTGLNFQFSFQTVGPLVDRAQLVEEGWSLEVTFEGDTCPCCWLVCSASWLVWWFEWEMSLSGFWTLGPQSVLFQEVTRRCNLAGESPSLGIDFEGCSLYPLPSCSICLLF